jgi:putative SOS response-associated peptidase YedK
MCGRLTITTTDMEIAELFGLAYNLHMEQERRYNVAPSQPIPVFRVASGTRELVRTRWGLIPHWLREEKPAGFVNARAETLTAKPAFRVSFRNSRCLVPASGFYEWKLAGGKKQPYYFRQAGGGLWTYPGIWDRWDGPEGTIDSVAILTVLANDLIQPPHDRMPAILEKEQFAAWLDPAESKGEHLLLMLLPFPAPRMECWTVSDRVNTATTDEPGMNDPVLESASLKPVQPTLFYVA